MLGGAAVVVLFGLLLLQPVGDGLARWSYDLPFLWANRAVPDDIVMIYFDPKIKVNLGQSPAEPLDRRFYVRLLDRLTADGAKLVLFDILFDNPNTDASVDAQLAEAIRKQGRVVLVGYNLNQIQGSTMTTATVPPTPVLANAAAGWGLAEISSDPADQRVRLLNTGSESIPSASWVAASLLDSPITKQPELRPAKRWLNFYGEPTRLRSVNLDQALKDDGLPKGYFRDKIVVVGARPGSGGIAGAEREEFPTPYSRFGGPNASGPAIHALSLLNLQRGDWMTRLSFARESALVLIWGLLVTMALLRFRPWPAILFALAAASVFALTAVWIQARYHVWFSWLVPAGMQTAMALLWAVGFQYLVVSQRRRQLRNAFAVYLSPHMADRIAGSDFDLSLGGKEVRATVMFTDLEGFTSMTEKLPPAEVSRILISYFNETTRAILENNGTIIKYMGDAVMAVWGAPMPEPRSAQMAVRAALGMRQSGGREIGGRRFRTRFGINTGLVLAGNLGSEYRFDYSVIGETTNIASRLEALNKALGTEILTTESTRRELDDQIAVRRLGKFMVAGTTRPLGVYEVLGAASEFQPPPSWAKQFDAALDYFTKHEFEAAEALFRGISELRGVQDGPANFYLKEIARARLVTDSGVAWDGVIRLESKY
jgi:adenylate cyclase